MLCMQFVACWRTVMNLYVILLFTLLFTTNVMFEKYLGWFREWNNTGYSLKYDRVCKYWLKFSQHSFTYITHSSRRSLIHHVNHSFITYIIHLSRISFNNHVNYPYITYIAHSIRTSLIYHLHYSFITYITGCFGNVHTWMYCVLYCFLLFL